MSQERIQIQSRADKSLVDAQLLRGMAPPDLLVVESSWAADQSRIMQQLLLSKKLLETGEQA